METKPACSLFLRLVPGHPGQFLMSLHSQLHAWAQHTVGSQQTSAELECKTKGKPPLCLDSGLAWVTGGYVGWLLSAGQGLGRGWHLVVAQQGPVLGPWHPWCHLLRSVSPPVQWVLLASSSWGPREALRSHKGPRATAGQGPAQSCPGAGLSQRSARALTLPRTPHTELSPSLLEDASQGVACFQLCAEEEGRGPQGSVPTGLTAGLATRSELLSQQACGDGQMAC